jgi:hypothetical protein
MCVCYGFTVILVAEDARENEPESDGGEDDDDGVAMVEIPTL